MQVSQSIIAEAELIHFITKWKTVKGKYSAFWQFQGRETEARFGQYSFMGDACARKKEHRTTLQISWLREAHILLGDKTLPQSLREPREDTVEHRSGGWGRRNASLVIQGGWSSKCGPQETVTTTVLGPSSLCFWPSPPSYGITKCTLQAHGFLL